MAHPARHNMGSSMSQGFISCANVQDVPPDTAAADRRRVRETARRGKGTLEKFSARCPVGTSRLFCIFWIWQYSILLAIHLNICRVFTLHHCTKQKHPDRYEKQDRHPQVDKKQATIN